MYTAIGSLSCKNCKLRIQAGSDIKEGRWKWKQSVAVGEREIERVWKREKASDIQHERGTSKKARREWKSVGWEREVGQKESWRREGGILSRCTVTYSCYRTQGVRFPPPSQSRRTERRQRGNEICCFISPNFSCWYFSLPWKSILSNRFLFDLVSAGTEIQYLSLFSCCFFIVIFGFYHAGVIIGQPSEGRSSGNFSLQFWKKRTCLEQKSWAFNRTRDDWQDLKKTKSNWRYFNCPGLLLYLVTTQNGRLL